MGIPYESQNSMTFGAIMSNQQIAESFLPNGWSINWNLPVWNVPPNTYSHSNKSPIQALSDLVKNCGGMLVPHRASQEFNVLPRYPVLPWDFSSVAPNITIPDSAILNLTEEPTSKYGTNGVHIHGEGDNGKQAHVRRTSTAGDRLAPTVSNSMMTDSTAIRSLGERVLASGQPQPSINSFGTWMTDSGGDIPLFQIGYLVQIELNSVITKGIASSVKISSTLVNNAVEVSQSIGISENTNNLINLFDKIRPVEPLQVATLSSNVGDECIVSLVGGGSVQLFGNGTVGQKYYIQGRELKTQAPSFAQLPDVVI
jgi:hypothetical protein